LSSCRPRVVLDPPFAGERGDGLLAAFVWDRLDRRGGRQTKNPPCRVRHEWAQADHKGYELARVDILVGDLDPILLFVALEELLATRQILRMCLGALQQAGHPLAVAALAAHCRLIVVPCQLAPLLPPLVDRLLNGLGDQPHLTVVRTFGSGGVGPLQGPRIRHLGDLAVDREGSTRRRRLSGLRADGLLFAVVIRRRHRFEVQPIGLGVVAFLAVPHRRRTALGTAANSDELAVLECRLG
jgi:hypothetical protein